METWNIASVFSSFLPREQRTVASVALITAKRLARNKFTGHGGGPCTAGRKETKRDGYDQLMNKLSKQVVS